ncbi:efflux transporter outer membrane subunit [Steroidobacter cummioxidans]|uniref:efflux transporter outer membrane subunit n=1 Tax=Steroidobacter cummioxidans TaxID=1803913 RepID=UPI000E312346|nr:efflux transporter outer membrane subunit [Steroidobacter cummioxidans]
MRTGLIFLLAGLGACSVGREYQRPDVATPSAWRDTGTQEPAAWPSSDWWTGFNSPRLNELIAQANRANDDIGAAIARVEQADAQVRIAGAPLLPSVDAGATATRERQQISNLGPTTRWQFGPQVNASYEVDFWGKNRATSNAAKAAAAASRYDRATVELTVMSSVASTYFQVLSLRERLDVAQDNLATAQKILKGLQLEQQIGTVTALDVAQQDTTVATLSAAIPPLAQQLRQSINALAILVGEPPENVDVTSGVLGDLSQPRVTPGLPSELLARRPDVAEAEAQLVAANADITAARAALFPSIELTASGGFVSAALSTVLNPVNRVYALTAALTQPIFEGGALRGQVQLNEARYTELLADYHKVVISAFGNVEDQLTAVQQTTDQEQRQQDAVTKARRAYDFAQSQMRAGTVNILTVLNTEGALFTAQDALVQAKLSHMQAVVGLFNALGGGWQRA